MSSQKIALIEKLVKNGASTKDILESIENQFPGWIISKESGDIISEELSSMKLQWIISCVKFNSSEPQCILLVKNTYIRERMEGKINSELPEWEYCKLCDILSEKGFLVRDIDEFSKCVDCGYLIVSKKYMELGGYKWKSRCVSCTKAHECYFS